MILRSSNMFRGSWRILWPQMWSLLPSVPPLVWRKRAASPGPLAAASITCQTAKSYTEVPCTGICYYQYWRPITIQHRCQSGYVLLSGNNVGLSHWHVVFISPCFLQHFLGVRQAGASSNMRCSIDCGYQTFRQPAGH
jgi:hypothetical protein